MSGRRTLVVHAGALGDTVLVWSLLRLLDNPVLVCGFEKGKLTRQYLEGVDVLNGDAGVWVQLFSKEMDEQVADALREQTGAVGQIITFVGDEGSVWVENAKRVWAGVDVICLKTRPNGVYPEGVHITECWKQELDREGVVLGQAMRPIKVGGEQGDKIIVHPGSGGASKCWGFEKYEQLITSLQLAGYVVQVVLGEVEWARYPDWCESWQNKFECVTCEGLLELGTVVERARLFVGNDAGPSHLAGVLDVPTVVLFGATQSRVWRPVGERVYVVESERNGMAGLDFDPVYDLVMGVLGKNA